MKDKFIRKYMRIAKEIGEYENSCYSGRKIGSVIVDPKLNIILSTGYNGPARGLPEIDSKWHLENIVWNNISEKEQQQLGKYINCKQCPRRLLNIPSGERLELCACLHSEHNAILQLGYKKCQKKFLFCYCTLPCVNCSIVIIQVGIKKIYCLSAKTQDYSPQSRPMLLKAGIKIIEKTPKEYGVYIDE